MKYNYLLIIGVLILNSCSIQKRNSVKEKTFLENTQWILEDQSLNNIHEITLHIEANKIFGHSSCNDYFGDIVMNDKENKISIKNIGSTKKYCSKMSSEYHYLNTLKNINKYKIKQNYLELYKDNILFLKFRKK